MTDIRPTATPTVRTLWIIRRGSGKAQVHPSPVHARPGDTIRIKNWTPEEATVEFHPELYPDPRKGVPPVDPATAAIGPGQHADFRVVPGFGVFEYDVHFPSLRQYAEGNSKPGVIVDP